MSVFFIEEDPGKKQKRVRRDIFILIMAPVLLLWGAYLSSKTDQSFYIVLSIPLFGSFLASVTYRFLVRSKKWFVDVNDTNIAFRTKYQENNDKEMNARIVDWNDIKWIKKENNNSISLYQQSSFKENISLNGFAADAVASITHEIKNGATARGIQIVDF